MITEENWTYCQYKSNDLTAFISFGASPDILDDSFQYYVTILDAHNNEVFQQEFPSIGAACQNINQKYAGLWDLHDSLRPKKEGGCSTCIAH